MDLVRGQCFEQYEKLYNKSGVPVYAFVIVNFSLIGIVGVIYSQVVKSRVNQLLAANRGRDAERQNDNPREGKRRLFVAYLCQLATRFAMGLVFIVLQTQVLYPANFPSEFPCQIARGSHAANGSSTSNIQNSTMYECHNQPATHSRPQCLPTGGLLVLVRRPRRLRGTGGSGDENASNEENLLDSCCQCRKWSLCAYYTD